MQRKMEFLGEAQVRPEDFSDDEISAYFALRPERYKDPAEISFEHIYFSVDDRGGTAESDALAALEQLRADPGNSDTTHG